jgi:hypothetical protein
MVSVMTISGRQRHDHSMAASAAVQVVFQHDHGIDLP